LVFGDVRYLVDLAVNYNQGFAMRIAHALVFQLSISRRDNQGNNIGQSGGGRAGAGTALVKKPSSVPPSGAAGAAPSRRRSGSNIDFSAEKADAERNVPELCRRRWMPRLRSRSCSTFTWTSFKITLSCWQRMCDCCNEILKLKQELVLILQRKLCLFKKHLKKEEHLTRGVPPISVGSLGAAGEGGH
jgi:hypothetical protein